MRTASFRTGSLALGMALTLAAGCADEAAERALAARLACPPGTRALEEGAWFGQVRGCQDAAGRWHGPQQTDWRNGQPRSRGAYREGLEDGAWRRFSEKGELREEGAYAAGQRHGLWRELERGALFAEGEYQQGRKSGPWRYFDDRGQGAAEGRLEDGQRTGTWTTWTEERRRCAGEYRAGQKSGRWVCWHGPEGEPAPRWTEGEYLDGLEQGRWTAWHPNGQVERTGEYRLGQREGRWQDFAPDGSPVGWYDYQGGRLVKAERTRP